MNNVQKKQEWFTKLSVVLSDLIISRIAIFVGAFLSGCVATILAFYPNLNSVSTEVKAIKPVETQVQSITEQVRLLQIEVGKSELRQTTMQGSLTRIENSLGDLNSYLIRK